MGRPTIASECKQNINNQILRNDFKKWYIMGLVPWYIISQNHFSKFVALSIIYYYFWNEISEKVVFVKWNITTHDLANQNNFINSWLGFASSFVYEIILICLVIRCDISFHKNHFFRNSTFKISLTVLKIFLLLDGNFLNLFTLFCITSTTYLWTSYALWRFFVKKP